jgi:hypothetical protein
MLFTIKFIMENDLIASKANCKLANVPSGIANAAQRL